MVCACLFCACLFCVLTERMESLMGFSCFSSLKWKEWLCAYKAQINISFTEMKEYPTHAPAMGRKLCKMRQKLHICLCELKLPRHYLMGSISTALYNESLEIYKLINSTKLFLLPFRLPLKCAPETDETALAEAPACMSFFMLLWAIHTRNRRTRERRRLIMLVPLFYSKSVTPLLHIKQSLWSESIIANIACILFFCFGSTCPAGC